MTEHTNPAPLVQETNAEPQLNLERIYVKDLSFEVPNPRVFSGEWSPELDITMSSSAEQLGDNHFHVVLSVTVNAKNQNTSAFVAEVHQAGIFSIANVPQDHLHQLLGAYCPNILFPYARESISDVVNRGSFPQLLLAPINFDAAYADSLEQMNGQTGNA